MEADSRIKTCTKCNIEKPLTEYYKQAGGKYGIMSICMACVSLLYKTRERHAPEVSPNYTKVCIVCGIERSGTDYYRNGLALDGLDSRCKVCEKERVYLPDPNHSDRPKVCRVCKETKTQKDFPNSPKSKDGLGAKCKICISHIGASKNNIANPDDSDKLKLCPGCNTEKPQSDFYKARRIGGGLTSRCKTCSKEYGASLNYLPDLTKKDDPKLCLTCEVMKTQADFYTNNQLKDGLQTRCKSCCIEFDKNRNHTFDESKLDNEKICANCGKTKVMSEFYKNRTQKSGLSATCKECDVKRRTRWAKRNSSKTARYAASRRARKIMATPKWADMNSIADLYLSADELTKSTNVRHSVDHIVPLNSPIVCGLHCEHNLRIITLSENCSKRNRYWPDMP